MAAVGPVTDNHGDHEAWLKFVGVGHRNKVDSKMLGAELRHVWIVVMFALLSSFPYIQGRVMVM